MNLITELLKKNKGVIAYVFFGICTTLINVVIYNLCYNIFGITNVVSNIIAWIVAVSFAFVTNKLFVFDSKSFDKKVLLHEISSFFGCRVATGVLDIVIMYIAIDILNLNALFWKFVSNILVIIANYIASKLIIFKKSEKNV